MRSHSLLTLTIASYFVLTAAAAWAKPRHKPSPDPRLLDETRYYADAYADHYQVPRELVHAIIDVESQWNPGATSDKGAKGLMQLMPQTAARYHVMQPYSITENISGGVQYLADLIREFGDLRLVVAAYYTGEHHIERRGLKYSNPDVARYVNAVRKRYEQEIAQDADRF